MNSKVLLLVIVVVFVIIVWCNGGCLCDGYSNYTTLRGGQISRMHPSTFHSDREYKALVNPSETCQKCMDDCVKLPGYKSKDTAIKDCSLKCFQACAVNENKNCKDTCEVLGSEKLCTASCNQKEDLGCRWHCKLHGSGDYCRKDCPSYS